MVCHGSGLFQRAAVLEIGRDSRCAETVIAKFGFDARQAPCDAVPSQPRRVSYAYLDGAEPVWRSQGAAVPHDRPRHRSAHPHRAAASECLCNDPPACGRSRPFSRSRTHSRRFCVKTSSTVMPSAAPIRAKAHSYPYTLSDKGHYHRYITD